MYDLIIYRKIFIKKEKENEHKIQKKRFNCINFKMKLKEKYIIDSKEKKKQNCK